MQETTMPQRKIMLFVLTAGIHQTNHPTKTVRRFRNGREEEVPLEVTYRAGEVVESTEDMEAKWPEKFQRVREENSNLGLTPEEIAEVMEKRKLRAQNQHPSLTPTEVPSPELEKSPPPLNRPKLTSEQDGLDALNYTELRKLCEAEEIPGFEGCTSKPQILVVMRASGCQAPKKK